MRHFNFIVLLSLPLLLAGCLVEHHHHDVADVEAFWTFEGQGCSRAGVRYVEVLIEDIRGIVYESGLIHCRDASALFDDLRPGSHWISAYGYPNGSSPPTWELHRKVRLHGGINELTLDLAPTW